MVLGELIFKARVSQLLWEKIVLFVDDEASDGYTGLLEYLEEPVNCHVEPVEGTKWCDIELGADSFRETEWVAIHRIIGCVLYYATTIDLSDLCSLSFDGLSPNLDYIPVEPFKSTKDFSEYITDNLDSELAIKQVMLANPLKKGYPFIPEEDEKE